MNREEAFKIFEVDGLIPQEMWPQAWEAVTEAHQVELTEETDAYVALIGKDVFDEACQFSHRLAMNGVRLEERMAKVASYIDEKLEGRAVPETRGERIAANKELRNLAITNADPTVRDVDIRFMGARSNTPAAPARIARRSVRIQPYSSVRYAGTSGRSGGRLPRYRYLRLLAVTQGSAVFLRLFGAPVHLISMVACLATAAHFRGIGGFLSENADQLWVGAERGGQSPRIKYTDGSKWSLTFTHVFVDRDPHLNNVMYWAYSTDEGIGPLSCYTWA